MNISVSAAKFPNYFFLSHTAWKESEYGVISGPYFPVFSPNTGKYGPEISPYLDTFHTVPVAKKETFRINGNYQMHIELHIY